MYKLYNLDIIVNLIQIIKIFYLITLLKKKKIIILD